MTITTTTKENNKSMINHSSLIFRQCDGPLTYWQPALSTGTPTSVLGIFSNQQNKLHNNNNNNNDDHNNKQLHRRWLWQKSQRRLSCWQRRRQRRWRRTWMTTKTSMKTTTAMTTMKKPTTTTCGWLLSGAGHLQVQDESMMQDNPCESTHRGRTSGTALDNIDTDIVIKSNHDAEDDSDLGSGQVPNWVSFVQKQKSSWVWSSASSSAWSSPLSPWSLSSCMTTWAGSKLVLIGPEAVSCRNNVLLSDKDSPAVRENSTSWS